MHEAQLSYEDHTIKLSNDWRFTVKGPLFDERNDMTFQSMVEAKTAIDGRRIALAKQKKTETLLAIQALDERGKNVTLRGIHASQGHLLGVEGDRVYPVHPVLRERLQRRVVLRDEVDAIDKALSPYGVNTRRTFGRTRPEDYDRLVQVFTDEFAAKTGKANTL